MTTSDLLSRMYQLPSRAMREQQQRLMRKLHTMPATTTSATTARHALSCNGSGAISNSSIAPYLHRVYWLLRNPDGHYLAALCGSTLQWVASANAVPPELRFCSHETVKKRWLQLQTVLQIDSTGIAIAPIDFYAHRNTPHLWCALDE